MSRNLFSPSDEPWEQREPHLPKDVRGKERADDLRVISGIVHGQQRLLVGDCPEAYGPPTTIYNRCGRWARRGIICACACQTRESGRHSDDRLHAYQSAPLGSGWKGGSEARHLAAQEEGATRIADAKGRLLAILLTGSEAHDCPAAERLIRRGKPSKHLMGDKACDSAELRVKLHDRGMKPVIPNRSCRKQPFSFNKRLYGARWLIENAFNRVNDFKCIATRHDGLASNYLASVCPAAALVWWIK